MRRSVGLAALTFFSAAFAQQSLENQEPAPPVATTTEAIPDGHVSGGPVHRLILPAGHPLVAQLERRGGALSLEDYGSFGYPRAPLPPRAAFFGPLPPGG